MSRATDVTWREEGYDPVHLNNFGEEIQSGQWRRESVAVGRARREDKGDARHTLRRGSKDSLEPRCVVNGYRETDRISVIRFEKSWFGVMRCQLVREEGV